MANPICLSPLKFYDDYKKQERFKSYAYGNTSPVVMPLNILYPFQFIVSNGVTSINSAYIRIPNDDSRITGNIIAQLKESGLSLQNMSGYKVVLYSGIFALPAIKSEGMYYLELKANTGEIYYSEIFCFVNSKEGHIEIEYWNPENDFTIKNGIITFSNSFRFKILISGEIGKPEYSFEEEATSRLGYNFTESQISKKIYKFNAVLPEYICDAMRLIRLCSNKLITCNGDTHEALSFEMNVDWLEQGYLASVNCEFEVDNIISNFGGFKHVEDREFNNDFNNDFKKN